MKHRLPAVLIGGIAAIVFGQIASAADLPVKAPVYKAAPMLAPVYNWTGWYVGGNVGGGWGRESVDYTALDITTDFLLNGGLGSPLPPASIRSSGGVLGGLQLGYNWQIGPTWLVGLETDFDWSAIKGSADTGGTSDIFNPPADYSNKVDSKVKWLGTVRGRVGFLPVPNLLTFVTGGFAYGKVEHTGVFTTTAGLGVTSGDFSFGFRCHANVPCFAGLSSNTAVGWTVGGGVEYALARNWTIRGEYLYVSLQGKSLTETAIDKGLGLSPSSFSADFGRTNLNIARLAVNYRF